MAVAAVNLSRVSYNLRAFNLLESIRANQRTLFGVQTGLATGLRYQRPSEDPLRSTAATDFDRRLDRLALVQNNLERANSVLNEVDTSMQEALDLLTEAQALAVQSVGDTVSDEERQALTTVINSHIDRLISIGNRKFLNTWLYAGDESRTPFEMRQGGIVYHGDGERRETMVDTDLTQDAFTVPGLQFFGAVSGQVQGVVDLDPALTSRTLISDLNGALGRGVTLGRIVVSTAGEQREIDLSAARTAGDLVDILNGNLPTGVRAALGPRGLTLTRTAPTAGRITVSEAGGGRTAADLGLAGSFDAPAFIGQDVDPRLTALTRIGDLRAGAGLNLGSGLVIRNGPASATIQFAGAQTVQDVLNRINHADIGAWARIADDGRTLEIRNRVSGTSLTVEENGGQAATALGLRSLHAGTALRGLNDGQGVETAAGADLRVTTASGAQFDVDLDGATTLQDVLDRLNVAGAGAFTAALASTGNGLVITDHTAGGGALTVTDLNGALVVRGLGLDVPASGNQLRGRDVNPVRVDSPFTALLELREGMLANDRQAIGLATQRLERVTQVMQQVQGTMAARARTLEDRATRIEAETAATTILLSDVRDVDFADAVVRFQQLQTALQANLSTAGQILNLSVLDYLR